MDAATDSQLVAVGSGVFLNVLSWRGSVDLKKPERLERLIEPLLSPSRIPGAAIASWLEAKLCFDIHSPQGFDRLVQAVFEADADGAIGAVTVQLEPAVAPRRQGSEL